MTRVRSEASVDIGRPVGEVFSVLCDARAWPTWARWARDVVVEPPGPVRVGTQLGISRGLVGRRSRTVTDMRPDRLIAIEDDSGSVRLWLHLEPLGDRTTVMARIELRSGGWFPLLRGTREKARMRGELRRLRGVVENHARRAVASAAVPIGSRSLDRSRGH